MDLKERGLAEAKAFQVQTGLEYSQKLRRANTVITCKKGCAYCCHYPFLITIIEGLLLYRWLTSRGRWTPSLRKNLKANRAKTLGLALEIWLLSNIPCPLLEEEDLCIAYEARPLHCRATYSTGDPKLCHPHALGEGAMLVPSSEIIVEYNSQLQAKLARLEMIRALMPLSEALILAESLENGAITIEELSFQYVKDLQDA
jgi:Fe-S-cluster containining protein